MASFTQVNGAFAQNKGEVSGRDYVFLFGTAHRDTAVVRVLYENAPQYINAPGMPRFAIIGKDRQFYLGIGGYLKGYMSYDIGNPIRMSTHFVPGNIPSDDPPGNGGLFQLSAATSNLFFNFVGLPHTRNRIGAYINFNFNGAPTGYAFSLRAAYITYRGFTLGYRPGLFTDGSAAAPLIDQEGPNAMTSLFNTVIDYRWEIDSRWSLGIGVEMPVLSATYDNRTAAVNQRVPDIPFYAEYEWREETGRIRLSGLIRNFYYRNLAEEENVVKTGWGIKLSGIVPFGKKWNLYYQGVYGEGITNYIQDAQGYGLDMVPVRTEPGPSALPLPDGILRKTEAWGAYAALKYTICPKVYTSATYGYVRVYYPGDARSLLPGDTFRNTQYVAANIFYEITPSVIVGAEYLWGSRTGIDDVFKQNTRLQTALRVNF